MPVDGRRLLLCAALLFLFLWTVACDGDKAAQRQGLPRARTGRDRGSVKRMSFLFNQSVVDRLFSAQKRLLELDRSNASSNPFPVRRRYFQGTYYTLNHMLVSEKYKFLFCPVQKAASTLFVKLFRRLEGQQFWYEDSWNRPTGLVPVWKLGNARLTEIFQDPSWTKAIFFRDPVDRLVSSYQQFLVAKVNGSGYMTEIRGQNETVPWPVFLHRVIRGGKTNIHWNPQTHFCAFHHFWRYYNFIGSFEQLPLHGRQLLDRLGIWEEFGAKQWNLAGVKQFYGRHYTILEEGRNKTIVRNLTAVWEDLPPTFNVSDCIFCKDYASHARNSSLQVSRTDWQAIVSSAFYSQDFEQWRLVVRNNTSGGPFGGQDLQAYMDYDQWRARQRQPKKQARP